MRAHMRTVFILEPSQLFERVRNDGCPKMDTKVLSWEGGCAMRVHKEQIKSNYCQRGCAMAEQWKKTNLSHYLARSFHGK
eukprot:1136474-Pelagomonas_calceolata.AAC.4